MMRTRCKFVWYAAGILILLFFSGACGQKEDVSQQPKVVSRKVVSKKVSKPAPKPQETKVTEKKDDTEQKADKASKEPQKNIKPKTPSESVEKSGKNGSEKVTESTLSVKKKSAFKPKSEISTEKDYQKPAAVQTAKKEDAKATDITVKAEPEKKTFAKEKTKETEPKAPEKVKTEDKSDRTDQKNDETKQSSKMNSTGKKAVKEEKEKKDAASTAEGKEKSESEEAEELEEKPEENERIAGLNPSKTLKPVKINPLSSNFKYSSEGKIDPFSSLFNYQSSKKKKRKRFPMTPLEKVDISQFKLVGVILSAKGNKAIVQEASGKGYVVSRGTYIGVNEGRVVKILKDRVVCEEEVENLFGETEIKSRILKLSKPPGAL